MNYTKTFEVLWANLDPNFHMRHTAYNDYAAQVRIGYLSENGFTLKRFRDEKLGPVIFTETTKYFKEVLADDKITVDFKMTAVDTSWRKWKIQHSIFRSDGERAADIYLEGAWFNTDTRKVVVPPQPLIEILQKIMPIERD